MAARAHCFAISCRLHRIRPTGHSQLRNEATIGFACATARVFATRGFASRIAPTHDRADGGHNSGVRFAVHSTLNQSRARKCPFGPQCSGGHPRRNLQQQLHCLLRSERGFIAVGPILCVSIVRRSRSLSGAIGARESPRRLSSRRQVTDRCSHAEFRSSRSTRLSGTSLRRIVEFLCSLRRLQRGRSVHDRRHL